MLGAERACIANSGFHALYMVYVTDGSWELVPTFVLQLEGQRLPNLSHPASPVGGEADAKELEVVGEQRCEVPRLPRKHLPNEPIYLSSAGAFQ